MSAWVCFLATTHLKITPLCPYTPQSVLWCLAEGICIWSLEYITPLYNNSWHVQTTRFQKNIPSGVMPTTYTAGFFCCSQLFARLGKNWVCVCVCGCALLRTGGRVDDKWAESFPCKIRRQSRCQHRIRKAEYIRATKEREIEIIRFTLRSGEPADKQLWSRCSSAICNSRSSTQACPF